LTAARRFVECYATLALAGIRRRRIEAKSKSPTSFRPPGKGCA